MPKILFGAGTLPSFPRVRSKAVTTKNSRQSAKKMQATSRMQIFSGGMPDSYCVWHANCDTSVWYVFVRTHHNLPGRRRIIRRQPRLARRPALCLWRGFARTCYMALGGGALVHAKTGDVRFSYRQRQRTWPRNTSATRNTDSFNRTKPRIAIVYVRCRYRAAMATVPRGFGEIHGINSHCK